MHRWIRALKIGAAAAMLLMASSSVALGQEGDDEEQDEIQPPPVEQEVKGSGSVPKDLKRFWADGPRDDILVGQLHEKEGRIEGVLYAGIVPNDPFLTYIPVGGRVGYYFTNALGVEVGGSFLGDALQFDSDLTSFLKSQDKILDNNEIIDRQLWRVNATVQWSPFYGKWAILQRKLSHFDIYAIGGLGAVNVGFAEEDEASGELSPQEEIRVEGIFGLGMRFFVHDAVNVRLDWRQGLFAGTNEGLESPTEFSLGVGYLFGG